MLGWRPIPAVCVPVSARNARRGLGGSEPPTIRYRVGKSTGADASTANPLATTRRLASAQPINREVTMTTKPSSTLYQPTARGRTRMLAFATAVALAISACLGASTSRADVGSVYFDTDNNAAAGDTNFLFNGSFTGFQNVGLGRSVMDELTTGSSNVATGFGPHVALGRSAPTRPATTTSPAARLRCASTRPAPTTSPPAPTTVALFSTTPPVTPTSPPAATRCRSTPPATTTSPPAPMRWTPTRPATTTSPPVRARCLQTRPAPTTSPPVSTPCSIPPGRPTSPSAETPVRT